MDAVGGPAAALRQADGIRPTLVRFQPHLYPIAATLVVRSETSLCGVPGKTTLRLAPGAPPTLLTSDSGAHNVTINGITFDGNKSQQMTGGAGVVLLFSHSAHIVNTRVQNFRGITPGGAALYLRGAVNPLVEYSSFLDNGVPGRTGSDGLAISGVGARVAHNDASGNTDTGFATQNSHDLVFEYNIARHNGNGFAAGSPSYQLLYQHNVADANLYGFHYCPCNRIPPGHDVTVTNNRFDSNTAAGIYIEGEPRAPQTAFTVTANVVSHSSGAGRLVEGVNGIFLRYVDRAVLRRNVVESSDNHGILIIGSTNIRLLENTIRNNSRATACAGYGIYVKDDARTPVFSDSISLLDNRIVDDQGSPTQGRAIASSSRAVLVQSGNRTSGNCR